MGLEGKLAAGKGPQSGGTVIILPRHYKPVFEVNKSYNKRVWLPGPERLRVLPPLKFSASELGDDNSCLPSIETKAKGNRQIHGLQMPSC